MSEDVTEDFTEGEAKIAAALLVARQVQDFIWGDLAEGRDLVFDHARWIKIFQKRADAIRRLDLANPSVVAELRKRVLQQAALSVRALVVLDAALASNRESLIQKRADLGARELVPA